MNIKIRAAIYKDIKKMKNIFVETIINTCKNDYNKKQISAWVSTIENKDRWREIITNQFCILVEKNSKTIGFGSLENGNYIDLMYVDKNYLRKGVANTIYLELKKESQRVGCDKITTNASKTSIPFFESKGFKIVRDNKNILNGIKIVNYHMSQ